MLRVVPGPSEQRRGEVDAINEIPFTVCMEEAVPSTWKLTYAVDWKVNLMLMSDLLWHIREMPSRIRGWCCKVGPEPTLEMGILSL